LNRIRRIKCDEGRPHCTRCVSTGRKCDGYIDNNQRHSPTPNNATQQLSLRPRICKTPPSVHVNSLAELRGVEYYQDQLSIRIAEALGDEFWKITVLQASQSSPVVKHALVALGLIGDRLRVEDVLSSSSNNGLAVSHQFTAQTEYQKALSYLKVQLNFDDLDSIETALIAGIILICFSYLQGDDEGALVHLRYGLNLVDTLKGYPVASPQKVALHEELSRLFGVLDVYSAVWLKEDYCLSPKAVPYGSNGLARFVPPQEFEDLVSASRSLTFQRHELYFLQRSKVPSTQTQTMASPYKQTAADFLDAWYVSFSKLIDTMESKSQLDENRIDILEVAHVMSWILLVRYEDDYLSRSAYHDYVDAFRWIIDTARPLIKPVNLLTDAAALFPIVFPLGLDKNGSSKAMPFFSFVFGMIEPLYFVAIMSPILSVAEEAIELLSEDPWREGAWDSASLGEIAKRKLVEFDSMVY
jgi:hypothetical protein